MDRKDKDSTEEGSDDTNGRREYQSRQSELAKSQKTIRSGHDLYVFLTTIKVSALALSPLIL